MIENKLKYSENHFFATNLDYVLNTNSNKILAGKWCFVWAGAVPEERGKCPRRPQNPRKIDVFAFQTLKT